ncbi:MAG: hypothetical protein OXE57_19895 [Alphaproteobacteria bacterium]|nr:hypothetical protein [Alphaproteobacteria bacterium]
MKWIVSSTMMPNAIAVTTDAAIPTSAQARSHALEHMHGMHNGDRHDDDGKRTPERAQQNDGEVEHRAERGRWRPPAPRPTSGPDAETGFNRAGAQAAESMPPLSFPFEISGPPAYPA